MTLNDIYAVILCGGEGKRLKSVVSDRPKPMAEVGGKPFLDLLIEMLENKGIRNIVLCTCYMSDYIKDYYARRKSAAAITVSEEPEPLGTAGALKLAEPKIMSNPFFVLNGDTFCNSDLKGMLDFHLAKKAGATMLLNRRSNAGDYGSVMIDGSQLVTGFNEKKQGGGEGLVNAGVYLLDKKSLEAVPAGTKYSLEYGLFPGLKDLYGFVSDSEFIDIGTRERYEKANCIFRKPA